MPIKVGKHEFKYLPHGVTGAKAWRTEDHRLVVRESVVRRGMWCADYRVGQDSTATMKRPDGMSRKFRTKENAMTALVKFWDNL